MVLHMHTDTCRVYPVICVKCAWLVLEFRASAKTGQDLSRVFRKQTLLLTEGGEFMLRVLVHNYSY